jgi:hypothetical protein
MAVASATTDLAIESVKNEQKLSQIFKEISK